LLLSFFGTKRIGCLVGDSNLYINPFLRFLSKYSRNTVSSCFDSLYISPKVGVFPS
jgi:hypothetical protein